MSGTPNLVVIRHARQAPPRRSPHRQGRITPDSVLDRDPRGRTICGADPGSFDLSNRQARSKSGTAWLSCPACATELEKITNPATPTRPQEVTP